MERCRVYEWKMGRDGGLAVVVTEEQRIRCGETYRTAWGWDTVADRDLVIRHEWPEVFASYTLDGRQWFRN